MTIYSKTDNYALNLYGDTDPADLRDGYNGSMHILDATLEGHLSRIEGVESRETHDEEVVKALLGDNTVDAATTSKTKWNKASADAATATTKATANTDALSALDAETAAKATTAKAKWNKAASDVAALAPQVAGNTEALAALHAETAQKANLLYQQIQQGAALGKVTDAGIRIGRLTADGVWDGYSLLVRRHGGVDVLDESGTPVIRLDETGIQYYDTLFNGFTYAASNTPTVNSKNELPATGIEKQKAFVTQENRVYVWHDGKWRIDGGYVVKQLTWIDTAQTPHAHLYIDVFYNPESGYVTIVIGYDTPIKGVNGGFVGNLGNLPLPLCPVSDDLRSSSIWLAQNTDYEVNMALATGAITFRTANSSSASDSHYVRGIVTYPCRAGAWATDEQLGVAGALASVAA